MNANLTDYDKIRLVLATLITIDVTEKDRKALTDQVNANHLSAIHNL